MGYNTFGSAPTESYVTEVVQAINTVHPPGHSCKVIESKGSIALAPKKVFIKKKIMYAKKKHPGRAFELVALVYYGLIYKHSIKETTYRR